MKDLDKKQVSKRKKTMLTSLLLSAPGPVVTGIPAITSHSATQIADFLRRSAELVALFISWWVYRKLQQNIVSDDTYRTRMEEIANLAVIGSMICSGIGMLIVGVVRLFVYKANGNVIMGLIIAVLGLLTNTWFWRRYSRMVKESFDPVIEGQQKMYRAKASVDLCVTIALTSVTVIPTHPITQYIDALGCIIVAIYLLYNGWNMIRKKKSDITLENA